MKTFVKQFYIGKYLLYVNINLKRNRRMDKSLYPKIYVSFSDVSKLPF